jgi:AraC family transcriptional regulator
MPVGKAIWYIENHLGEALRLDDVARSCGLSKFHLTRAFGSVTGFSVMGYVRARRLSEAARILARDGGDILAVALDAGYGSHEAFTRAFREQFGTTPEAVRAGSPVDQLKLLEPLRMTSNTTPTVEPVRFHDGRAMRFAGFSKHFKFSEISEIPSLWQRFIPHIGHIPGEQPSGAWGVSYVETRDENGFDYMAGVEIAEGSDPGSDLKTLSFPALQYAVFIHDKHVSEMNSSMQSLFDWAARAGFSHAEPGLILERYTEEFNGETGLGGMEIWLPVKK